MDNLLKIFIGFDRKESVAWHTMAHSILSRSSKPVALIPLNLSTLKNLYWREPDPRQSNEFSFSRFLVPYLCGFRGCGLYFDCDMLLLEDVYSIFTNLDAKLDKAIYVVKHDYRPKDSVKYLGNKQESYPRKNWSSVVLWNCEHPSVGVMTPQFVNQASAADLHRFTFLKDSEIGELDVRWNWLVGEYDNPPGDVKNVHWTVGGPYFEEYSDADYAAEWFEERDKMMFCARRG
jgi:hypothetical protein